MDEILHHLRHPGMMVPLKIPANHGFNHGFLGGANWISSIHSMCVARHAQRTMVAFPGLELPITTKMSDQPATNEHKLHEATLSSVKRADAQGNPN